MSDLLIASAICDPGELSDKSIGLFEQQQTKPTQGFQAEKGCA